MNRKTVFGPIHSRRLGRSLGINLLPFKTCSLDCVYCECGATTDLTLQRQEFVPLDQVRRELDTVLDSGVPFDYVTFSGLGEPTLYSRIGGIIRHVKNRRPDARICLLTNATLLDVAGDELDGLDLIVPSLDGSCEEEFRTVNRPAPGLSLEKLVRDIAGFRKMHPRITMWLEIFIVPGVNDSDESVNRFRSLIGQIAPDKVQLNSLDRKGAVDWIRVPSAERMREIQSVFAEICPTEIIPA